MLHAKMLSTQPRISFLSSMMSDKADFITALEFDINTTMSGAELVICGAISATMDTM